MNLNMCPSPTRYTCSRRLLDRVGTRPGIHWTKFGPSWRRVVKLLQVLSQQNQQLADFIELPNFRSRPGPPYYYPQREHATRSREPHEVTARAEVPVFDKAECRAVPSPFLPYLFAWRES